MTLAVGQRFADRFTLLSELGEGGMGRIYEVADTRLRFLGEYGDVIRARLASGPLPLSEALERGWCVLDGTLELAELLGVYVAPWALTEGEPIELRIPREVATRSDGVVGELIYSDLELARVERGASA